MSSSSDNFATLLYFKNKAKKWQSISFLILSISVLLLSKFIFFGDDSASDIEMGNYIAEINIEGVISDDEYRTSILEKIAKQENIKAVIVNINSPGGGIVGSEILYNNLREISITKPIVVVMGSLAASGGYMTAIASDYIIARNGTLTGSIGVIMQASEFTELANKLGIKFITYKSSPLKGSPSPFEKSNSEVEKVINESIKDSYNFFTELVKERRNNKLKQENLKNILDGRIFTGREALKNGLIDEIGGKNEALKYLKNVKKIDISKYSVRKIDLKKEENALIGKLIGEDTVAKIISNFSNFDLKERGLTSLWGL